MQSLQKQAVRSARQLKPQSLQKSTRLASSHGPGHDSHHKGPTTESFGNGFYICLAAIPTGLALYKLTSPGTDGEAYFTRKITDTLGSYRQQFIDRNALHTQSMEQAAADRTLFLTETSQSAPRHVDHRYPEILNASSPWNVPAGNGSANIDTLIAKYQKEAFAENEKRLQQVRDNKVPAEQPYESFRKITPAAADS